MHKSQAEIRLLVGLGNPGRQYQDTRHNVGFWVLDQVARSHHLVFRKGRFGQSVTWPPRRTLLKPETFMNRAGDAVGPCLRWLGITPASMVVVADDLDLPLGRVRIRANGSSGGHNGLKSVTDAVGTQDYPRLKIGIGRPHAGVDVVSWVLGRFSGEEMAVMVPAIEKATAALLAVVHDGVESAMNQFNGLS